MRSPTTETVASWRDPSAGLHRVLLRRRGALAPRGPYAVLDLETTGLDASVDRVVEVAVVRCDEQGRTVSEWSTLVHPDRDPGPTDVHGITADDLATAPRFAAVLPELLGQIEGAVVTAHNLAFDAAFLATECRRTGHRGPDGVGLCTLTLARSLYPGRDGYSLATCSAAAGIEQVEAHRALADARVTAQLLSRMLDAVPTGRHQLLRRRLRLA
jgi:DNA polymerase III epsilon subunit family exonuclease